MGARRVPPVKVAERNKLPRKGAGGSVAVKARPASSMSKRHLPPLAADRNVRRRPRSVAGDAASVKARPSRARGGMGSSAPGRPRGALGGLPAERGAPRRLPGKTSPRLALAALPEAEPRQIAGGDYYALLGIDCTATAERIRQAYRRKALAVHPDKLIAMLGREPTGSEVCKAEAEYIKVAEAFDLLSDDELRAQYDREQQSHSGAQSSPWAAQADPQSAEGSRHQDACGKARVLLEEMLVERRDVIVADLEKAELVAMRILLSRGPRHCSETKCKNTGRTQLDTHLVTYRSIGCISYYATVQWAAMRMRTPSTGSLERALAWRSALTLLQNNAKARLAHNPAGPPVVKQEIERLLLMEPDLWPIFNLRRRISAADIATPATPNWQLALSHHDMLTKAFLAGGLPKFTRVRSQAKKAVERERSEREKRCSQLLPIVLEEIDRRLLEADQSAQQQQATRIQQMQGRLQFMEQQVRVATQELEPVLAMQGREVVL